VSFPDLQPYEGPPSVYHAEAEGVPVNGVNEFSHGLRPEMIQGHESELEFHVWIGTSILDAELVGLSDDLSKVRINFIQTGADSAKVRAVFIHSTPY